VVVAREGRPNGPPEKTNAAVRITGELQAWPDKQRMADILRDAGLRVTAGPYSVRVQDCSHFVFQHYGGEPVIDADAESLD
jgi:hypothetical protein